MIFGILSDTHGSVPNGLLKVFEGVDCIIHAGDIGDALVLHSLECVAPVIAVRGNIDEYGIAPARERFSRYGKSFTVIHNAGDIVRPAYDMFRRILPEHCDILISGHYHGWWVKQIQHPCGKPVLWLSPGAAGNSGHHNVRTAMRLTIRPEELQNGSLDDYSLERIDLGPREMNG